MSLTSGYELTRNQMGAFQVISRKGGKEEDEPDTEGQLYFDRYLSQIGKPRDSWHKRFRPRKIEPRVENQFALQIMEQCDAALNPVHLFMTDSASLSCADEDSTIKVEDFCRGSGNVMNSAGNHSTATTGLSQQTQSGGFSAWVEDSSDDGKTKVKSETSSSVELLEYLSTRVLVLLP